MQEKNRILYNSGVLYFRMFITLIIGLYSSRVLLNSLGVFDYGIYNVVGGFVYILAFLNTIMISTTFRYITVEIGRKNQAGVNLVFSTSFFIHAAMLIALVFIGETIGLYYVKNYLNVTESKVADAVFVFHFSILASCMTILSIPLQGVITAKENFNSIAIGSILNSILLLVSALLLKYSLNSLRTYAIYIVVIQLINLLFYLTVYLLKYKDVLLILKVNFAKLKEMLFFSGWIMFGAGASMAKGEGSALLINSFFGPILNTAFGIANQVSSQLNQFAGNLGRAVIPQITKSYSSGDIERSVRLTAYVNKFSFFLFYLVALPILLETSFILKLWLGNVPKYSVIFCQLIIVNALIEIINCGIPTLVQAHGNIKVFQVILSLVSVSSLWITYIFFKMGYPPQTIVIAFIFTALLNLVLRQLLLQRLVKFDIKTFTVNTYIRPLYVILFSIPLFFLHMMMAESFLRFFLISSISVMVLLILIYLVGLRSEEKTLIKQLLFKFYNRTINKKASFK